MDDERWLAERFQEHRPQCTIVQIDVLSDPARLSEIDLSGLG